MKYSPYSLSLRPRKVSPRKVWAIDILRKAKLEGLRWHDATRHTFITTRLVQKLVRWKDISTVMSYAHHYSESLRYGVEALGRMRKNIHHITIYKTGSCLRWLNSLKLLARPARLERATCGFVVRRSIQLSYGRILIIAD
jgi:hypothetical protein